jgi:hypothetical protein
MSFVSTQPEALTAAAGTSPGASLKTRGSRWILPEHSRPRESVNFVVTC